MPYRFKIDGTTIECDTLLELLAAHGTPASRWRSNALALGDSAPRKPGKIETLSVSPAQIHIEAGTAQPTDEELALVHKRIVTTGQRPRLWRSVDELKLSVRSANCLQNANIHTLEDLVQRTEEGMLQSGFGRKSIKEIKSVLAGMGLELGMKIEGLQSPSQSHPATGRIRRQLAKAPIRPLSQVKQVAAFAQAHPEMEITTAVLVAAGIHTDRAILNSSLHRLKNEGVLRRVQKGVFVLSVAKEKQEWTATLVREYVAALGADHLDLLRQALQSSRLSAVEFSSRWKYDWRGVGHRFRKLRVISKRVAPNHPVAVELAGDRGHRIVKINKKFAQAADECLASDPDLFLVVPAPR